MKKTIHLPLWARIQLWLMNPTIFGMHLLAFSVYYSGCDTVIPDPVCSDCPDKELGRVRSIFLQRVDYTFVDITNPVEWQTAIQNRDVYVFPYTKGTFTMNEVLTPGFGNVEEDMDSYENILAVMEPNFKDNRAFWNAMKKSHAFKVGWRTESYVYVSDTPAVIIPKFKVDDDLRSKVIWDLGFKFIQEDIPQIVDMPVGTFDLCITPS